MYKYLIALIIALSVFVAILSIKNKSLSDINKEITPRNNVTTVDKKIPTTTPTSTPTLTTPVSTTNWKVYAYKSQSGPGANTWVGVDILYPAEATSGNGEPLHYIIYTNNIY